MTDTSGGDGSPGTSTLPAAPDAAGGVTLQGTTPFALVAQSMNAIGEIADQIAARVRKLARAGSDAERPLVILADEGVLGSLADLRMITAQLDAALGVSRKREESPALAGMATAAAFLSNATALLSYLKVDRSIEGHDPAVEDPALQSRLAGALIDAGFCDVLLPMHLPALGDFDRLLARALNMLASLRQSPDDAPSVARAGWLESILTAITTGEGSAARLAALHAASGLAAATAPRKDALLVAARLLRTGGHSVVDKHLFTLIGIGGRPRYSGGAAVRVSVTRLTPAPVLVHADTLYSMTQETTFEERGYAMPRRSF